MLNHPPVTRRGGVGFQSPDGSAVLTGVLNYSGSVEFMTMEGVKAHLNRWAIN